MPAVVFAISLRYSGLKREVCFFSPLACLGFLDLVSSISPMAILATCTAHDTVLTGRFVLAVLLACYLPSIVAVINLKGR